MSFTLPVVDLSTAVVNTTGTVSWAAVAPQAAYAASGTTPHLAIFNESGCGLTLQLSTGEQLFLPAGGWRNIALNPACTSFSYSVAYVMNGALVDSLIVVWFGPEEEPPPPTILGNSPIGGSVTTGNTAELLQGAGQSLAVTEQDDSGSPALRPAAGSSVLLCLGGTNQLGSYNRVLSLGASTSPPTSYATVTGLLTTDQLALTQTIITVNNEATTANGVVSIVAGAQNLSVTATTTQTLFTYTTPNDGAKHSYQVVGWLLLVNSISPNNVSFLVNYTDSTGAVRNDTIPLYFSTGQLFPSGGAAIANGHFNSPAIGLTANPNTAITVTYRDPTNTPADRVTAYLQRLS